MTRFIQALNYIVYRYLKSKGATDETTAMVTPSFFFIFNILSIIILLGTFGIIGLLNLFNLRLIFIVIAFVIMIINYRLVYNDGKYYEIFRNIDKNKEQFQQPLWWSRFYMRFTILFCLIAFILLFTLR